MLYNCTATFTRRGGGGGEAVADSQASPHASKDKHLCVVGSRASAPRGRLFVVLLSLFPLSCYQDGIPGAAFLTLEGSTTTMEMYFVGNLLLGTTPIGGFPWHVDADDVIAGCWL